MLKGTQLIDKIDDQQNFIKPGDPGSTFWFGTGQWNGSKFELEPQDSLKVGKDYTVTVDNKTKQMTIELLHDIDKPLLLEYAVNVPDAQNGQSLQNTVQDNHNNTATANGIIDKNTHVQLKKTCMVADDAKHTIDWQVDINTGKTELSKGYVFTDTMYGYLNGKTVDSSTMGLVEGSEVLVDNDDNNRKLEAGKDYTISHSGNEFTLTLNKTTSHRLQLNYQSQYDGSQDKNTVYRNTFADNFGAHGEDQYKPSSSDVKYGNWHAKGNYFEWHVMVNTAHASMSNAVLTDPIQDTQILNSIDDVEIYKQDPDTGKYTVKVDDVKKAGIYLDTTYVDDKKAVEVEFANGDINSYDVVIKTTPADPTKYVGIDNTATFTNGGTPETLPGNTLWPVIAGHLIDKTGAVDQKNTAYVNWQLKVNWAAAHLEDVTVTDVASNNQIVDPASIKIYPATLNDTTYNDGAITIDYDNPQTLNDDYELEKTIDGHTGKTTTKIHFKHDLDQPYIVEYRSQINVALATDQVTNSASITGNGITEEKNTGDIPVTVQKTSVSGSGDEYTGGIEVLKESPDGDKLKGAQFTLTPAGDDGNPDTSQTRSPITTDADGKCSFENLLSGTYFIKEVTPPEGYKINPEYAGNGKEVSVTFAKDKDNVVKLEVVDYPKDTTFLPRTGGWQAGAILIAGMMAMLISGVVIRRRTGKEAD